MRMPFMPRRVRVAVAAASTLAVTLVPVLAPPNHASASREPTLRVSNDAYPAIRAIFVRQD